MSNKGHLLTTLIILYILCFSSITYASKVTEIMSEALKQRSNGNILAAITGFKKAVKEAPSLLQRNLALFMLGDCQMEASQYTDAIESFTELSKKATTADERAEALYKLMEANSNLNNSEEVNKAFAEIKAKYPKSAYFKIAEAFISAEEILDSEDIDSIVTDEPKIKEKDKTEQIVVVEKKPEPKPAIIAKTEPKESKTTPVPEKKQTDVAKPKVSNSTGKKLDGRTSSILEEILNLEPASDSQREELVGKILSYQDQLKSGEKGTGKDKVLFDLAVATTKFGELLEACKTFDKILSLHPTSPLVEDAYYQSIRLRAILGVHQAVIEWSRAFNITFPNSKYKQKIAALVAYSQAGGKVQLTKGDYSDGSSKPDSNPAKKSSKKSKNKPAKTAKSERQSETFNLDKINESLKNSSLYKKASQKMNDGKYDSALEDLKVLASKFPDSSQLWWDTTLVYVQLEEFRKADKSIKKMLLLDPENSDANSLLGYIQYRLENYDEAASAYEQAADDEEGEGVSFFDAKTASKRMKKNASR